MPPVSFMAEEQLMTSCHKQRPHSWRFPSRPWCARLPVQLAFRLDPRKTISIFLPDVVRSCVAIDYDPG